MTNWFQASMGAVKTPQRKKQPVPATVLMRNLDICLKHRPEKPQKYLYVSQLNDLTTPEGMKNALISYWLPAPSTMDYKHELYTEIGNLIEDVYVRRLMEAGVAKCTDPNCEKPREQHSLQVDDLGVRGRIDALLDVDKVNYLGAKTPPKSKLKTSKYVINEVKTTGAEKYKYWKAYELLPDNYLTQFSFYVYYAKELGLTDVAEGFFTIISRDNLDHKTLWGEPVPHLIEQIKINCGRFWEFVRKREIPYCDISSDWVYQQIESQPDRDWHPYCEIDG